MGPIGLDFGTTNSAVSRVGLDGSIEVAKYTSQQLSMFRSVLFLLKADRQLETWAGPEAIEAYLREGEGRFVQSIKSHLASKSFTSTQILGKRFSLDELLVCLLSRLRDSAESSLGPLGDSVVVGRPFRYAGTGNTYSEALAVERTRRALNSIGFVNVEFLLEPVAAALDYETALDRDEIVLVADFGGGTSDFSVVQVGPSFRRESRQNSILSTEGVAVAGDSFDGRIVRNAVAPSLGLDARFTGMDGKLLSIPKWILGHLEAWHLLSFLKERSTMSMLVGIAASGGEAARVRNLIAIVRENLGFHLFRAVERVKIELSTSEEARLEFEQGDIRISRRVSRQEFEAWIAEDLAAIDAAVGRALTTAGISANSIDRVFMTGGTSRIPSVQAIFRKRFPAWKIDLGAQFTSVASGLSIAASRRFRQPH